MADSQKIRFEELFNKNTDEPDLYKLLDCNEYSTHEQIVAEYRAKSLKFHPDKFPNDPNKIEIYYLLNKAYEILGNPEERKQYDLWRHSGLSIPYDTWRKMEEEKRLSFHWKSSKLEPQQLEGSQTFDPNQSTTVLIQKKDSNSSPYFTEAPPGSLLEKFRRYQV